MSEILRSPSYARTQAGFIDNMFVDGEGAMLMVESPSDESEIASFKGLSLGQFEQAILSARRAFDSGVWSDLPAGQRAQIMRRFADALAARKDRLRELIIAEVGCPINDSVMKAQVDAPLRHAYEIIDLFLTLPEIEDNPVPLTERINAHGQVVQSLRRFTPVGVVAGIPAYNVPFFIALWKVVPALIAGNAIILRPHQFTPLSALLFGEAALEAGLPAGILNIAIENGIEGAQLLTSHPAVDMVGFTGSSAVGEQVMKQAASTMKRLQLELGGKSAQIFLPDALDRTVAAARIVCTSHAGQGCSQGTRIFVPEERKAEVIAGIVENLRDVRTGPSNDAQTQQGPLISAGQVERCERYVALAVEHGASVALGGARPDQFDKGHYYLPTVLDVPDNKNPVAQDEIFGPVVAVIGYRDLDHAVEMANDSRYGLSGYVHGADRAKALQIAMRLRTGTVNVNGGLMSAYASIGGHRMSGLGRERGPDGLRIYQQVTCLQIGA